MRHAHRAWYSYRPLNVLRTQIPPVRPHTNRKRKHTHREYPLRHVGGEPGSVWAHETMAHSPACRSPVGTRPSCQVDENHWINRNRRRRPQQRPHGINHRALQNRTHRPTHTILDRLERRRKSNSLLGPLVQHHPPPLFNRLHHTHRIRKQLL
jgi:hypothetical protein